jgi:hypothetical protein
MLKNQHPNAMSIETDNNKAFIKNKLKSLILRKALEKWLFFPWSWRNLA